MSEALTNGVIYSALQTLVEPPEPKSDGELIERLAELITSRNEDSAAEAKDIERQLTARGVDASDPRFTEAMKRLGAVQYTLQFVTSSPEDAPPSYADVLGGLVNARRSIPPQMTIQIIEPGHRPAQAYWFMGPKSGPVSPGNIITLSEP